MILLCLTHVVSGGEGREGEQEKQPHLLRWDDDELRSDRPEGVSGLDEGATKSVLFFAAAKPHRSMNGGNILLRGTRMVLFS